MSTTFDILDRLYPFVNVTTVTSTINGRIYRRKRPLNSAKRDVVLVPLSLADGEGMDVQPGMVVINCYAPNNTDTGQPDELNLMTMSDAVISRIAVWNMGTSYLHLEPVAEETLDDTDRPGWSYTSIRIEVVTQ